MGLWDSARQRLKPGVRDRGTGGGARGLRDAGDVALGWWKTRAGAGRWRANYEAESREKARAGGCATADGGEWAGRMRGMGWRRSKSGLILGDPGERDRGTGGRARSWRGAGDGELGWRETRGGAGRRGAYYEADSREVGELTLECAIAGLAAGHGVSDGALGWRKTQEGAGRRRAYLRGGGQGRGARGRAREGWRRNG